MSKSRALFVAAFLLSLCGCAPLEAQRQGQASHVTAPKDQCDAYYINQSGPMSVINATAGQPGGVRDTVVSVTDSKSILIDDANMLGLPTQPTSINQTISCYATLHYRDGSSENGILSASRTDPAQPYRAVWFSQASIMAARKAGEARRFQEQRKVLAYSDHLQACTFAWKVAVEAKSLLGSGESADVVADDLIARHAYGPNGQVYRGSEDMADLVRQVTYATAMTPDERDRKHLPDFSSQGFLADCPRQANLSTQ